MRDLIRAHLRALFVWEGQLGRLSYLFLMTALVGALGYLCEGGGDWTWVVTGVLFSPFAMVGAAERDPSAILLAGPFLWSIFVLSVKRLRDVDWAEEVALLTFLPIANIALFVTLGLAPGWKPWGTPAQARPLIPGPLGAIVPKAKLGGAAFSVITALALSNVCFDLQVGDPVGQGVGMFVILPAALGALISLLFGFHEPRTFRECLGLASFAFVVEVFLAAGSRSETVGWLLLSMPLTLPMLFIGVAAGYAIQLRPPGSPRPRVPPAVLTPLLPVAFLLESGETLAPRQLASKVVNAPVEQVAANLGASNTATLRPLPGGKTLVVPDGS